MLCDRSPSAAVRAALSPEMDCIFPDRKLACASAANSGSTPITLAFGFDSLIAVAMPLINPPPPIGHKHQFNVRHVFKNLQPNRSLSRDDLFVVVRRHRNQPALLFQLFRLFDAIFTRRSHQHNFRAHRARCVQLHLGRGAGITIVAFTPSARAANATPCA